MKIIFESEAEMRGFFDEQCPGGIGLEERCTLEPFADVCESCWKAAVECEVSAKNAPTEPKAMVVLETIPDNCYECPCFNDEYGICQITKECYGDYDKKKLDNCPIIMR